MRKSKSVKIKPETSSSTSTRIPNSLESSINNDKVVKTKPIKKGVTFADKPLRKHERSESIEGLINSNRGSLNNT